MFNNSFAIPGLDEDRHNEADAARPALTLAQRAEVAAYDLDWRNTARDQAPLDGCEADASASPAPQTNCEACGNALHDLDGLSHVMCECGAWNNIEAPRVPHLRLVAAG